MNKELPTEVTQVEPPIMRSRLNSGLPPIDELNGFTNCVLAALCPSEYAEDGSNHYMPAWTVTNTKYYHKNQKRFLGWIGLEELHPGNYK